MSCSFLGRISTEEGGLCGQGRNGSLILRQTDCIQAREGIKKVEGGMYHGFVSRHTKTKSVTEKQFCSVLWRSGLLLFLLILFVCLFVCCGVLVCFGFSFICLGLFVGWVYFVLFYFGFLFDWRFGCFWGFLLVTFILFP